MGNGRFGPIKQKENTKKKYKMDYNRLITFVMVIVIAVLGVIIYRDYKAKEAKGIQIMDVTPPVSAVQYPGAETPEPKHTLSPDELRPLAETEGLLPVFNRANTNEKRIAITVEGLNDSENINTLIGLCATYGVKLTFFPTGEELTRDMRIWPMAILSGHQIENHTYSNKALQSLTQEDMVNEIIVHTSILRSIIGNDYQPHFLRTNDMSDDLHPAIHKVLTENGYFGVVRWRVHTPSGINDVEPGAILAYTLNDKGLKQLSAAIPVLIENGFEMVTLNELFMYPDNFPQTENNG